MTFQITLTDNQVDAVNLLMGIQVTPPQKQTIQQFIAAQVMIVVSNALALQKQVTASAVADAFVSADPATQDAITTQLNLNQVTPVTVESLTP